jgi:hypothetical protein
MAKHAASAKRFIVPSWRSLAVQFCNGSFVLTIASTNRPIRNEKEKIRVVIFSPNEMCRASRRCVAAIDATQMLQPVRQSFAQI